VTITSLAAGKNLGPIGRVSLLGSRGTLKWERGAQGLAVRLPREKPCDFAYVLKISE
jgi:alpha-L-fucosidase